jgi:hypothetical protein
MRYLLSILFLFIAVTSDASEARHVFGSGVLRNMTVRSGFNALSFDGAAASGGYVTIANNASNQVYGQTKFSVAAWVLARSAGSVNGRIFDKTMFQATINTANKLKFFLDMDTDMQAIMNDANFTYGVWHHCVFVFNEDGDNKGKIYIDGTLQALATDTAGVGAIVNDSSPARAFIIGNFSGATRTWDGLFRRLTIYAGTALTQANVTTLYNGGQFIQNQASPIPCTADYYFNEGSGTVLTDSIGGVNGTLTNGPVWQIQSN